MVVTLTGGLAMQAHSKSGRAVLIVFLASLSAHAERSEAGQVRGKVIDREGKPAAGAKVWAAKLGYLEPLEVHESKADDSGVFAIDAEAGGWVVFALRGDEGGRSGWNSIAKVEEGKNPASVTVRLGPPTRFKGRLLDSETGEPITKGQLALDDARRLEVDAQGRFEASGLELTHHEAYPLCPGYERKRILFDTTGRPDAELELKLPRAGKVVGRVAGADGKPIPGASVGLATSGSIFSGSALWQKCDEDGRFSYDGKPLGRTGRLTARAPGYQNQERADVIVLDAVSPTEIDFTLLPDPTLGKAAKATPKAVDRRTVSGTVVGPDGKPVASAVVRWGLLVSSDSVPETKTDAEGVFRLEGVPADQDVLSVMAKGLTAAFPPVDAGGDRQVKVELKAGMTIRGRVVDDAGKPIEGVRVVPEINNPKPNWSGVVYLDKLEVSSDRDGRFTLEGMPEGVMGDFVADGLSAARRVTLSPTDESKNVVTLLGEGAIRGRVLDPAGTPVKNFRILVGIPDGTKPGDPVGGYFAGYGGPGLTFTRDDGEFTISGLTAGNLHKLTVLAEKFGGGKVDRVEAQSKSRLKPADALTIKLGSPYDLHVRVFQAGGKAVEGARVTLIQSEAQGGFQWGYSDNNSWEDNVSARVNAEGWAEFPFLGFGTGTVIVRAKGFSRMKLDWAKNEEELEVFLEPEARFSGVVLDESGKVATGMQGMLSWGNGEMMNVSIDAKSGRFQVDGLRPGKYQVAFGANVAPMQFSESIELEAGKTLTKDIHVKKQNPGAPARRR